MKNQTTATKVIGRGLEPPDGVAQVEQFSKDHWIEPSTGKIYTTVSVLQNTTLAVDSQGNFWSWGGNTSGALFHAPVEVNGDLIEQVKRAAETEYERSE